MPEPPGALSPAANHPLSKTPLRKEVNILHISEQLEAAKAENNPDNARFIILQYLTANDVDLTFTAIFKLTEVYFLYPQSALKTLEQYAK